MHAKDRVVVRVGRAGRGWRRRLVALLTVAAAAAVPAGAAGAAEGSGSASAPVVKVGMIYALSGPVSTGSDAKDALLASIEAFNKRGGVGANGARMEAFVCDSRADANQEVACARQMVDEGVVATLNDLTFNNPAGVVEVLDAAGIPRVGVGPTNLAEFTSPLSYPVSAGPVAGYVGNAVGFEEDGNTKICLARTDASTGATFKAFIEPMFTAVGVEILCDVEVATGATDYTPYVAELQQSDPDAVLISHTDAVTTQLIAAMAQLNAQIPLGGNPGSFALDTMKKYDDLTDGTVLSDSYPYPVRANVKNFPGLKRFFADMKASGLKVSELTTRHFSPWMATLAFTQVTKDLDEFTPQTVVQALETAQDVDLLGLIPPWTPSTPGFSVFESSSNHFVYVSRFNGKTIVTDPNPVDVTQYIDAG
jgi:ABC-type branched-subunit amino acid transport system substrate-binding protein